MSYDPKNCLAFFHWLLVCLHHAGKGYATICTTVSTGDLVISIAQIKGVRSCTKIILVTLCPMISCPFSYREFALSIFSLSIPQHSREHFKDSKCKEPILEEIKGLAKK